MNKIIALTIFIPLLLSRIFIAAWVYRDAKSKEINPHMWTILILFFSGSVVFLLYILIVRNEKNISCENCNYTQSAKLTYCGRCGSELRIDDYTKEVNKHSNNLLLGLGSGFLIITIILIISSIIFTFSLMEEYENNMTYSIVSINNKYGDKWKERFKYKNGEWSHSFKIGEKTVLNSNWNINDGYMEVKLHKGNEIIKEGNSKDNPNYSELIDLSQYKGEKVLLQVEFTKASGKIDFHLE